MKKIDHKNKGVRLEFFIMEILFFLGLTVWKLFYEVIAQLKTYRTNFFVFP